MPARELYMRPPDDPAYKDGILEVSEEIEILLNQIKMILLTDQGDVLGAPDFGMSLEDMLFSFDANEYAIQSAKERYAWSPEAIKAYKERNEKALCLDSE